MLKKMICFHGIEKFKDGQAYIYFLLSFSIFFPFHVGCFWRNFMCYIKDNKHAIKIKRSKEKRNSKSLILPIWLVELT